MNKEPNKKSSDSDINTRRSMKRQIIVSIVVILLLLGATVLVILYGKGFRPTNQGGVLKLSKTGILSLNSYPNGAEVYINGHLTVATNNNSLNLAPGKYNVKITKEGYSDWQKDFEIKPEQVSYAEATLFPQAPSLQSISTYGIQSAIIDPTGTKLAFNLASSSAKRNGIYVYDMTSRNFPILAGQSNTTQIVDDTGDNFSQAKMAWSPDGTQILASISASTNASPTFYLLNTKNLNQTPQDITALYTNTLDLWKQQRKDKEAAQIKSLPAAVQKFAKTSWSILSWSPDENEILYQASQSAEMPVMKKPRLIGDNNLYEQRRLDQNSIYVYNIKEDFNTRILNQVDKVCTIDDTQCNCDEFTKCPLPLTWLPDSNHLLYVHNKTIYVIEDDGSNQTTLYAGPFVDHYVFPWPDGSKLVILTNFNNSSVPPTLYSIGLK
ncbi:MAG: PEGA domain-containing protein [Candidatus Levyibacteriota bacterium]